MQLGMPTLIENTSLEENVSLCRKLGLNFIELNMNFPEYQIDKIENVPYFEQIAHDNEIYYTIHLDENLNIADYNPLVRTAYLETVRRTIEAAKRFRPLIQKYGDESQPMTLNMHMNHGIYITLPDKKVRMYERNYQLYEQYFDEFRELCEEWIGDADIRIVIENTDGFFDFEKRVIDRLLTSSVFALTWDIGHSKATKEVDLPYIMAHEDRLIHFHIHDGKENPPKNHLALGDGETDLQSRLALAEKCNARCVLETKTIEALQKSVAWMKTEAQDECCN